MTGLLIELEPFTGLTSSWDSGVQRAGRWCLTQLQVKADFVLVHSVNKKAGLAGAGVGGEGREESWMRIDVL